MDTSMLRDDDYLQQYRNISAKLKKRFLRKPNVAEASDEFASLQRALADSEVWTGAGLCCIAVARCHQSLANAQAEAGALTQAARYYAKAEEASRSILCPSLGDHLLTSSSCYRRAIALHTAGTEGQPLPPTDATPPLGGRSESPHRDTNDGPAGDYTSAAALSLELARTLQACDNCSEALPTLQSAAELLIGCPVQQLHVLQELQQCYIKLGDLDGALKTSVRILEVASSQRGAGAAGFRDIVSSCEVTSLLLLLVLEPQPTNTPDTLKRVLQQYTTPGSVRVAAPFSNHELLRLLQCLTLAVMAKDKCAVADLLVSLTPILHHLPYHLHLLHIVAQEVRRG